MQALNAGALSRGLGKHPQIRVMDLMIMIYNIILAEKDPLVGFEDANNTVDMVMNKLNNQFEIDPSLVESALWACNLLDETKKFWHPTGVPFEVWVKRALPFHTFNKVYNTIERKEK